MSCSISTILLTMVVSTHIWCLPTHTNKHLRNGELHFCHSLCDTLYLFCKENCNGFLDAYYCLREEIKCRKKFCPTLKPLNFSTKPNLKVTRQGFHRILVRRATASPDVVVPSSKPNKYFFFRGDASKTVLQKN